MTGRVSMAPREQVSGNFGFCGSRWGLNSQQDTMANCSKMGISELPLL